MPSFFVSSWCSGVALWVSCDFFLCMLTFHGASSNCLLGCLRSSDASSASLSWSSTRFFSTSSKSCTVWSVSVPDVALLALEWCSLACLASSACLAASAFLASAASLAASASLAFCNARSSAFSSFLAAYTTCSFFSRRFAASDSFLCSSLKSSTASCISLSSSSSSLSSSSPSPSPGSVATSSVVVVVVVLHLKDIWLMTMIPDGFCATDKVSPALYGISTVREISEGPALADSRPLRYAVTFCPSETIRFPKSSSTIPSPSSFKEMDPWSCKQSPKYEPGGARYSKFTGRKRKGSLQLKLQPASRMLLLLEKSFKLMEFPHSSLMSFS
mmetsp:Transcript_124676/g.358106  ORF Transcript_124676/g.358106 Transcript_124676/m.358106 type:complete len:330 (-) Transcript_124676:81-1070(-)